MQPLLNKIVWVTGAGSGIGEAAALTLAKAGGAVVLSGRGREPLETVAHRIRAEGGTAHVEPGDLMDPDAVKRIGAAINDKIGRLDILVNNAGVNINDRHWDKLTHEGKTRLIEFGRFAAQRRAAVGQRRPETFNFLGFTHDRSKTRNGKFVVKRKTQAKRLVRKLKAIREEMLDRMHTPVREQHRWLRQVLRGHYQYDGVIFNYRSLRMFKDCVVRLWRKTLSNRSQKGRVTWGSYKQTPDRPPTP